MSTLTSWLVCWRVGVLACLTRKRANAQTRNQTGGFTLVELMLVVVIIGVLAAMVIPRLAGRTEQAKVARAKSDIAAIGLALDLYELDIGSYPDSDSLKSLLSEEGLPQGVDRTQWKGPYLKKGLPKDPWGHDYQYKKSQTAGKDYELMSYGPDGQPGGNDDITN